MARISIHPTRDTDRPARADADAYQGSQWVSLNSGSDEVVFFFDDPADMPKAVALRDAFLALFSPKAAVEAEAA